MGDKYFEISKANRTDFIDRRIVAALPETDRTAAKERTTTIVDSYVGRDSDALSILKYAAEQGKFDEFAGKLEDICRDHLSFVDPEIRRWLEISGTRRSHELILNCYKELGIKSRNCA